MAKSSLVAILSLAATMACAIASWGAPAGQDPYMGYVYPAGGQQGAKFQVTIRGQRLRGAADVYISGKGVHASVVEYEGAGGPLNLLQQEELRRRLIEIRDTRFGGLGGNRQGKAAAKAPKPADPNAPPVVLPDLPELRNLDQMTAAQLRRVAEKFTNPAKRPKPPIAERVTLEVTVDRDAAPGDRELRLRAATGLSNPLVFQVGQIPETRERTFDEEDLGAQSPIQPPVVLNGQIMPGEVDRFPLQLRGGQKLVIAVQARKLMPYLADAVPGWFQAVAAVRDADGKELACQDDCGFDPDPAFVFAVPRDGQYTLEIRDAIYRGREDFVYRVDVGDESLIKSLFPMGSRGGVPIGAASPDKEQMAKLALAHFGSLPLSGETEPNNTGQTCMRVTLPRIVSGCVATPGDKDVFGFDGKAGQQIVAEVYARRMGSPLDSLLRLIDTTGRVVASNDDHEDMESGLLTHQADSYLSAKLPANGRYFVQLTDAQRHGGPTYNYYLRVGPPQPDFSLCVTPSSLNAASGRAVAVTACAMRKDGWDGDIDVTLKDAPAGFALSGARIPKGRDQVRMTIIVPRGRPGEPIALHLEGHAQIAGKTVTRQAIPADNMEQAFAYHHLVPADELVLLVTRNGMISPSLDMAADERLRIPSGGSAQISFSVRPPMTNASVHLELSDPPAGITLQDVKATRRGYTVTVKADDKHVGYADNLIVEAFTEIAGQNKKNAQKQRVSAGVLPAVPFEIVENRGMKTLATPPESLSSSPRRDENAPHFPRKGTSQK
jgi:hypothetical protein